MITFIIFFMGEIPVFQTLKQPIQRLLIISTSLQNKEIKTISIIIYHFID